MTDNDFNPVVEIQAEVQVTPTLELQAEVDMGSLASERNAEAWAVGQRGGVDVSSTDQTYHNNAKYWAEQAEQTVVGSIIDDTSTALNKVWSAHKVSEEFAETNGEVTDLKSAKAPIIMESISTPADVQTFSDGADGMPVKTLTVGIEPVQAGSGDPSPDNIRPITGHTGANVTRTGKNLVGITLSQAGDNNVLSNVFSLKAGTYTLSVKYNGIPTYGIYLRNGNNASSPAIVQQYNTNTLTFTLEHDYEELCFSMYYGQGITTSEVTEIQIEQGSTASAYEAFSGSTTEYAFPEAAGTVYGGTLTIHQDGSGELVVDREKVDLGDLTWTYTTDDSYAGSPYFSSGNVADKKAGSSNMICSQYAVGVNRGSIQDCVIAPWNGTNALSLACRDDRFTDAETFKTAMSGVQLVYELATPVVYTLTVPQVLSLLGTNNLWADTGKINAVEYPADTKLYIAKVIAELGS